MKNASIILLTAFYLLLSVGVNVNVHYCGGKLSEISLVETPTCCCGEMGMRKGCCSDQNFQMQLDTDHQISPQFQMDLGPMVACIFENEVGEAAVLPTRPDAKPFGFDLPPPPNAPAYLLHCSFTFYG
ncbi:MAG: hypothetical protein H6581_28760 [Bacteroidia bacterium]|nr:hypothetical protein [Bacteroidia bacterium]